MAERARELPETNHGMNSFFGVIAQGRTYKNIAYLLLSFPLGILYFVAIVTGLSTGVGLLITVLGIFVLMGTALMVYGFSALERYLAKAMVGVEVMTPARGERPQGFWNNVKYFAGDPALWKGMVYQMLRFPLGIFAFVVLVTMFSMSLGFMSAPVAAAYADESVRFLNSTLGPPALVGVTLLGVVLFFATLHVSNGMALGYAHMARVMLGGNGEAAPAKPVYEPLGQPVVSREAEKVEAAPQV